MLQLYMNTVEDLKRFAVYTLPYHLLILRIKNMFLSQMRI